MSNSDEGGVSFQTTLRVKDACLCLHVQRAARALGRQFDEAFRPFGITNGQFSLLMSLNRPEPPPMGPVAELLAMDRTTLTAALKPLERRGFVKMIPHPHDRRSKLLMLTATGKQLLAKAMPVWESEHAKLDELLHGDAASLRRMLNEIL
ncbi:MAG: MarR family winged helix-turn-helix transcriptional regulator [Acidobacteriota bacterium]